MLSMAGLYRPAPLLSVNRALCSLGSAVDAQSVWDCLCFGRTLSHWNKMISKQITGKYIHFDPVVGLCQVCRLTLCQCQKTIFNIE